MWNKVKKYSQASCDLLELVVGGLVLIGVIFAIIGLLPELGEVWTHRMETEYLLTFLEEVLTIVIGIEFLKMLCRPNSDNVCETLIFLVARHLILGATTPIEDFVSVISIAVLCGLRRYLHVTKEERKKKQEQEEQNK